MGSDQYRLLWSGLSRSKKIKQVQGERWMRLACHLVYSWMLPWADDDGRLIGDALWILANVVPHEHLNQEEIKKALLELDRVELIQFYEIEGEDFIQINNFVEKQRIRRDRYKKSNLPPAPGKEQIEKRQPPVSQASTTCQPSVNQVSTESQPKEQKLIPYQEIIEYLNGKAGKHFSHTSQETKRLIKARWNQGFELDAFKFVIDVKCTKWLTDPKMIDYIRPQTLFGTKFESYLNETTTISHKLDPVTEHNFGVAGRYLKNEGELDDR